MPVAERCGIQGCPMPPENNCDCSTKGISAASEAIDFDAPSEFLLAYPVSREWLTLLIRRIDAVASVYRLSASMSPGIAGLRSHVEFPARAASTR